MKTVTIAETSHRYGVRITVFRNRHQDDYRTYYPGLKSQVRIEQWLEESAENVYIVLSGSVRVAADSF